ncbi:MAG: MBL fold metallo-hydrolase [Gemmatimonadota bacterium]
MQITIVGTGTAVPEPDRGGAAVYVESADARLLLDCGPSAVRSMASFDVPWSRLTHLALTHFHTDHIGDLPALFFALKHALADPRRDAPLTVLGPAGTARLFERLAAAFGDHLAEPGFPVRIRELDDGAAQPLADGVRLRARRTPHTDASLAYRIESAGSSFGYTGDTALDEGVAAFFEGVDVLLAECSLPDDAAIDTHLTPSRVAALAQIARPHLLVLTHIYPKLPRSDAAARVRRAGWDGEIRVAVDGARIRLPVGPAG